MKKLIQLSYCCDKWQGSDLICKVCGNECPKKEVPLKRGGVYYIDGVDRPLPSVTTVLQVLAKPALTYWFKQKTAEAVFADPTISMSDAIATCDKIRDKAASRGGDIHRAIDASAKGLEIQIENYSEPWRSYIEAYLKFQKEMPHKILAAEQIVYSSKHGFAGQLDCIAEMPSGEKILFDWKTSKNLYSFEMGMQLAAYKLALEEMRQKVDRTAIIHLKSDSTYSFVEMKGRPEDFLACLHLYKAINA